MKLTLTWALPLVGILFAGCGGDQSTTNQMGTGSTTTTPAGSIKPLLVGIVFDKGGKGDKSFNDSAWSGVQRATKDMGVLVKQIESKSDKDYEPNLTAMADQGCDIVFAIGGAMKAAVQKVSTDYRNVKFAIVDASVKADNVRSLLFKAEQGSFLAGYLAGLETKTGKIGFVGGQDIDLIKTFLYGYEAGARTANAKVTILPAKYTGDWDNVDTAKAAADTLFGQGADIVYHAAGRAGLGVIASAKDHKLFAIGVDSDQDAIAPGFVLTSMVKHVDDAVYQTIKDLKSNKFTAGDMNYDLKSGLVGLSTMKYTAKAIGKDNIAKVKAVKEKIIKGTIAVPSTDTQYASYNPAKPPSATPAPK